MSQLRGRLAKLETSKANRNLPEMFRIIVDGEPTEKQAAEIAAAGAVGKFVINRQIIDPAPAVLH